MEQEFTVKQEHDDQDDGLEDEFCPGLGDPLTQVKVEVDPTIVDGIKVEPSLVVGDVDNETESTIPPHSEESLLPWKTLSRKSRYRTCSVSTCRTPHPPETTLHQFPRDPKLREAWTRACVKGDSLLEASRRWRGPLRPETAIVCSRHFSDDCFERDLRFELLKGKRRRLLRPGSVPTVNLLGEGGEKAEVASKRTKQRRERLEKRRRKAIVKELLNDNNSLGEEATTVEQEEEGLTPFSEVWVKDPLDD